MYSIDPIPIGYFFIHKLIMHKIESLEFYCRKKKSILCLIDILIFEIVEYVMSLLLGQNRKFRNIINTFKRNFMNLFDTKLQVYRVIKYETKSSWTKLII